MSNLDLSEIIKKKMDERNMSLQKVADLIPISKQGFHNWIYKRKNINWKLESLLRLSEILEFDIEISKGNLFIKECYKMNNQENTNLNQGVIQYEPINARNKKYDFEICKRFSSHSIVKLYVPNTAINDDVEASLLEEWIDCYNTKEECFYNEYVQSAVEVFALMNNGTGELEEIYNPSLYIDDIETAYLLNKAPIICKTEDDFDIVHKDEANKIFIVRGYAEGYVSNDNGFYVSNILNYYTEKSIPGLVVIEPNDSLVERNGYWYSNTRYLYEDMGIKTNWQRYFDKNRNEIKTGDNIILTQYADYISDEEFIYMDGKYGNIDNFEEGTIFEVLEYKSGLCFVYENTTYDLNELRLLKWEVLR